MGKRLIDSQILYSPDLYDLGWFERYVVVSLILLADDVGIACAQRDYLRRAIVGPWRSIRSDRVDALIDLLEEREIISSHMRGGRKFVQFNNWSRYQKLSRPRKSTRREENDGSELKRNETKIVKRKLPPDPMGDAFDRKKSDMVRKFGQLFGFAPAASRTLLEARGWSQTFLEAWTPYADRVRSQPVWKAHIQNFDAPMQVPDDGAQKTTAEIALESLRDMEAEE